MIPDIFDLVTTFAEPIEFVITPQKRIFWLYLLSSAAIAGIVVWVRKGSLSFAFKMAVSPKLWFHPSSLHDFQWLFFNNALRILVIVPTLGGSLSLAIVINRWLLKSFGEGDFWLLPDVTVSVLFTTILFLVEDFSRFLTHYCFHKVPWLWRFHAVHHSAEVLTPVTLYRIHWLEMIVSSIRGLVVLSFVSAIFMYLLNNRLGIIDILGVSVFTFLFNFVGANLRHSHVWLGFGVLECWFISPAQHQIHHSTDVAHIDKNFGATLAIWDRMFGSLLCSKKEKVTAFGLIGESESYQSLPQNFWGQCYRETKHSH